MLARRGVALPLVTTLLASAVLAASAGPGYAADPAAWPVSTSLVVAEVSTGGASASDEYVELYNAGTTVLELGGNELVYVTATGATTTRKASFTAPLPMAPGAHLLVANSAGIYAALADATYSGGLAADGGTLVLRTAGGSVIDSVGWGTAANPDVETTAAPAPPARSSIERKPGAAGGNWLDTNDNSADWFVQSNPVPQPLASPPVPRPIPSPSPFETTTPEPTATETAPESSAPTPTMEPTDTSSPEPTAGPTPEPTDTASTEPTAGPTPEPSPEPTPSSTSSPSETPIPTSSQSSTPTATPSPTPTATSSPTASSSPTAGPTPTPMPTPTPTPSASTSPSSTPTAEPTPPVIDPITIASARLLPAGSRVHVSGVVTAPAGVLGSDGLIAMGDSSAGIFVRLAAPLDGAVAGRSIDVIGTLSAPYGQLEIRDLDWISLGETGDAPVAIAASPADVGEQLEGSLVTVAGTIDSVSLDTGRLTVVLSDGRGSVRAFADPPTGLIKADAIRGRRAVVTGIVGQRATATGREDGYRIWLRCRSDLTLVPLATPSPPASDSASATPPPGTATPRPSATPRPTATSTPVYTDLAHGLVKGRLVDIEAVVTAPAGVIDWGGTTIVVDDGTAAVAVVVPAGAPTARVGARVHVAGKVGSLHSGLRVVATLLEVRGDGPAPQPRLIARALGPDLEWQLVSVCGHITRVARAGQRWRADLDVAGHPVIVLGEPGAAISSSGLVVGRLAAVTGIVRRSTSDPDVFDLLPRSPQDLALGPGPATPIPAAKAGAMSSADLLSGPLPIATGSPLTALSDLPAHDGQSVTVAGVVTEVEASSAVLDDGSGVVRLAGEAASAAISLLEVGDAIEVSGTVEKTTDGWTIEVDPERVIAFAGAGFAAATPSEQASQTPARPSGPDAAATPQQGPLGQSQSLARPARPGSADTVPAILGPVAAFLALASVLGLVLLSAVWRLARSRRKARSTSAGALR